MYPAPERRELIAEIAGCMARNWVHNVDAGIAQRSRVSIPPDQYDRVSLAFKVTKMNQKIYATVIKAISIQKRVDASSISASCTLESLGISSLDAITIMYEIEDALDLEIPNEALENLSSVQDIVDGISQLVQSKA